MARPPAADEQTLSRRVVEAPDDTTLRLVLADWYDDNGQPDRAEFVRGQIRLAEAEEWDDGAIGLQVRCEELLRLHAEEWLGPLGKLVPAAEDAEWPTFARGFPERFALSVQEFLENRERLFRAAPVTAVRFRPSGRRGLSLDECPEMRRLRSMWFDGFGQWDGLNMLASMRAFPQLSELAITGYTGWERESLLAWATGLSELVSLRLDFALFGMPRAGRLGWLPPRLRKLRLGGEIEAEALPVHDWAPAAGTLTHLAFDGIANPGGYGFDVVASLFALTSLELRGCPVGNAGAERLAGTTAVESLARLVLGNCQFGEAGVLAVVNSPHLAGLRSLDLSANLGGDAALQAVGRSPMRESLRVLLPPETGLSDRGVVALARGPGLPNLTRLRLPVGARWAGGPAVTPEAVRAVLESPGLPALLSLELSGEATNPYTLVEAIAESPGAAKLRELRLGVYLTRGEVQALVESEHLERLAVLDVRLNELRGSRAEREMLRRRFGRRARVL